MRRKKLAKLDRRLEEYIEKELYDYDENMEIIEELKEGIILEPPMAVGEQDRVSGGPLSDPTARKGLRLLVDRNLQSMETSIRAINTALAKLNPEHRTIFNLRYQKGLEWVEVETRMHISSSTGLRRRRELINEVADQLGKYDWEAYKNDRKMKVQGG